MDHVNAMLITLTGLVAALTSLVPIVIRLWSKVSAHDRKFDRFWRARLLRGTVEGLAKQYLSEQINSEGADSSTGLFNVAVTPEVYESYAGIVDQLLATKKNAPEADDLELTELIEDRFGPWITANICPVLHVAEFACLVMALSIAKGIKPVDFKQGSKLHSPLLAFPDVTQAKAQK